MRVVSLDKEMDEVQQSMARTAQSAQDHIEKLKQKLVQEKKMREQDSEVGKGASKQVRGVHVLFVLCVFCCASCWCAAAANPLEQ